MVTLKRLTLPFPVPIRVDSANIGTISHNFNVRKVSMNHHLYLGPVYSVRVRMINFVITIKISQFDRNDGLPGCFEITPQRGELPFWNEFVTVQQDAPVARTLFPRFILETSPPCLSFPLPLPADEPNFLRVDGSDLLVSSVRGIAFVHDNFVSEREMMFKHLDDVIVIVQTVFSKSIQREFHWLPPYMASACVSG
jgi:hypothetical protein